MNRNELEIIEKWLSDPSFINWMDKNNDADTAKWNTYFREHPEYVELAEVAKFSIELKPKAIPVDRAKSMAALSRLQTKMEHSTKKSTAKVRRIGAFKLWQVAASLLFVVACFWGYATFNSDGDLVAISTQEEQKEIELADGSKVILNAHSTIKYFEKEVRNIELTGEAYFEVAKDLQTQAKFQVKTKDLTVTVLGTEFNVNTKSDQTSVYLDEGKVNLNLGDRTAKVIEMKPGELVSYSKNKNQVLENKKVHTLSVTAWKEQTILFADASITKVLRAVSAIYDVKLESNLSADEDQLFTGGIPVDNLDITLEMLKEIYQLNIEKIEEKYILEKE